MTAIAGTWYAIAAEHDVPQRHVYRTTLGGHELAVWRSRAGAIQVWDNRCPHRGVRFSLGEVVGDELRCQYHAWRFATTGACTFIPAQPDRKVPGSIRATPWPVAQAGGLIWTGIDPQGAPPALAEGAVGGGGRGRGGARGRPPPHHGCGRTGAGADGTRRPVADAATAR
jgi:phenylpropionate dioxygenase-like ring-hydroxylating dioxygenase large terminal subunit